MQLPGMWWDRPAWLAATPAWYPTTREERERDGLVVSAGPEEQKYFVGADLGQARDPTALSVVERADCTLGLDPATRGFVRRPEFLLRHLERVPLGTPYTDVVRRIVGLTRRLDGRNTTLVVDATGVGAPVLDMLTWARVGCRTVAAVITAGYGETQREGRVLVPKRDLMVGLQMILQGDKLRVADGLRESGRLLKEMDAIQVKVTARGHEQIGAWREGEHDDLVFAVALAVWQARKKW